MRRFHIAAAASLAALTALTAVMTADAAKTGVITQYNLPAPRGPVNLTVGADGNLWFSIITPCCDTPNFDIGRLTPSGEFTGFQVPTPNPEVDGITLGPDGNVWFAELNAGQLGNITPQGVVTEFPLPARADIGSITAGPDGNIWFTSFYPSFIGRMNMFGGVTEFTLADPSQSPGSIVAGPDGALWYTEGDSIGRITTAGDQTSFQVPNVTYGVGGIGFGRDGNLWYTAGNENIVGKMTLSGKTLAQYVFPYHNNRADGPGDIIPGPDGAMWVDFSSIFAPGIARITLSGKITEFAVPNISEGTSGIVAGPPSVPKSVWFAQQRQNDIDKMTTR